MSSRNIQTLYHEGSELTSYRNNVVCERNSTAIHLNSCGWYTLSTAKAMNHALRNTNYAITRKQDMFIMWYWGEKICEFKNLCAFNPCSNTVYFIDGKYVDIKYGKGLQTE